MIAPRFLPLLALLGLAAAPTGAACHPIAASPAVGVLADADGFSLALFHLYDVCEGDQRIALETLDAVTGRRTQAVLAVTIDVEPEGAKCLVRACGESFPAGAFTVRGDAIPVDLRGVVANGHLAYAWSLTGTIGGSGAAFVGRAPP